MTVISIDIGEADQAATLGNVNTIVGNFEANRNMKIVRKNDLAICHAVIVRILKDQELILGLGITNFVVRIALHRRDPKTSFVVKGNLHGILEIRERLLRGKHIDLV